jgi:hypothetical protein
MIIEFRDVNGRTLSEIDLDITNIKLSSKIVDDCLEVKLLKSRGYTNLGSEMIRINTKLNRQIFVLEE